MAVAKKKAHPHEWNRQRMIELERLYLVEEKQAGEIAKIMELPQSVIYNRISSLALASRRRELQRELAGVKEDKKTRLRHEATMLDKPPPPECYLETQSHKAFLESVKIQSQEITEGAFGLARDAIAQGSSKDLDASMRGANTAVQLYRQAVGADDRTQTPQAQAGSTVNVFLGAMPDKQRQAPEPIDITPRPAKD